jgi:DUF971 family protein
MISPSNIAAIGNEIAIAWSDGSESYYPMERLRAFSPSAENTGERDLLGKRIGGTDQTEFPGVTVKAWRLVGSYALQFDFSDQCHRVHATSNSRHPPRTSSFPVRRRIKGLVEARAAFAAVSLAQVFVALLFVRRITAGATRFPNRRRSARTACYCSQV